MTNPFWYFLLALLLANGMIERDSLKASLLFTFIAYAVVGTGYYIWIGIMK